MQELGRILLYDWDGPVVRVLKDEWLSTPHS